MRQSGHTSWFRRRSHLLSRCDNVADMTLSQADDPEAPAAVQMVRLVKLPNALKEASQKSS
jgi:hypothetical protein